ncbi:glycosyltransferase [Campylobacter sp. RM12640]|uniref:glycosyltransferase n=1 Tax=unclassified Campylobacter TaxID=2593542 RepID=UPI003014AB8E|nr:glycosyltransferase [Campylobacter sp. RM12640]MBZ7989381.1 glycosyltransferase [Campylobacter sp. RM12635]
MSDFLSMTLSENQIIVKNAEGDLDTKATILIKNKIDYIPKVSVIIPVYNTEKYLRECLDSVINQSLKEIEIICIDDGSTDNSLEILKEYAAKDNRITVLTQENMGVSVARNCGLEIATGKYIQFLDSDDWLDLNTLITSYNVAYNQNIDMLFYGRKEYNRDSIIEYNWIVNKFHNNIEKLSLFEARNFLIYSTDKLYKSEFLKANNIKFTKDIKTAEDGLFMIECYINKPSCNYLKEYFYNYRIHNNSVTNKNTHHIQNDLDGFYKYVKTYKFKNMLTSHKLFIIDKYCGGILYHWNNNANLRGEYIGLINEFILYIESNFTISELISLKKYVKLKNKIYNINLSYKELKLISVIIPIYNSETYLAKCLDSILAYKKDDLELVCVDDGSTDDSLQILKEYKKRYQNIIVLKQENKGAGTARNYGLSVASGKFIFFMDSDDWIESRNLENILDYIKDKDLDFCKFKNYEYDEQKDEIIESKYGNLSEFYLYFYKQLSFVNNKELIKLPDSPWSGIYKREFLLQNHIYFDNLKCGNDVSFFINCLIKANKVFVLPIYLVYYRVNNPKSLIGIRSKNFNNQLEQFYIIEDIIKDQQENIKKQIRLHLIWTIRYRINLYLNDYLLDIDIRNKIYNESKIFFTNLNKDFLYNEYCLEQLNCILINSSNLEEFYELQNQPKVSVLIPIYNNEKYLKECIDSVINQTLRDIEIILLDDGSTDNSAKMCDEYAMQDKRVKVIHKPNSGYGATINLGLKYAKGEYIGIVESDDYIEKDMYLNLYEIAKNNCLDIIKSDFKIFYGSGKYRQFIDRKLCNNSICSYSQIYNIHSNINIFRVNNINCNGIFKRTMIINNSIKLNETPGASFQDNGFWVQTFCYAKRIMFVEDSYYRIRRDNPNSSVKNKEKVFCMCEEMDFIDRILQEKFSNNNYLVYQSVLIRFHNYIFTLDRIDDSFRLIFLERFAKDFKYYLSQNLVNDKFFSKNEINTVKQIVKNPKEYYEIYHIKRFEKDKNDLNSWYRKVTGKTLNLENPKTLNEKIQWMKLYDSTPVKTRLADKYLVREWIKEQIGEEYLIPLLGVYDKFEEIDFDKLPNKFVIKCNHGCSYNIIVKNKAELDLKDIKNKLDKWMNENYAFRAGYELHYLNIEPKIIIEEYIENVSKNDLVDYKFFCFNGKLKYVYTVYGRESEKSVMATYDMEWKQLDWCLSIHQLEKTKIQKPNNFDLMKEIAEKLSKDFNFVRVDLYLMDNGQIYFGEMTFTPMSGFAKWNKSNIDLELGKMIKLPKLAYNIYTREYYKPKKTNILKKVLKLLNFNQSKYIDCDNVLSTYRIDVKNYGFKDNKVQIIQNENEIKAISTEKSNGYGFVGNDNTIEFKIIKSGKLVIDLFNDSGNITYNQIKLNGKNLLKKSLIITKNNSYKIKKYVFNNQKFKLEIDCNKKAFKVNIRNVRTSENSIELLNNSSKINISTPDWFSNDKGIGSVLTSQNYKDSFKAKAIGNGNLLFKFMGIDKRFNDERIPLYVNYQSIKINGKEILKEPTIAWHDKAFAYEMKVKDGEVIDVEVVKSPYPYTKNELKDLIIKLSNGVEPNDINNIIENIIKNRLEYEKSMGVRQTNKLFSITREKHKTRYYFLGLKYVKFNTRREILDLIKEENTKLRKEIEHLKNRIG